ncbi:MAG TPA: hypothetical protein VFB22_00780 [Candidatus Baltobacteraceae bacterium]|nr:hypothetical protein [Candidatus Baltobacteraceae bacterium]
MMIFNGDHATVGALLQAVEATFKSDASKEGLASALAKRLRPFAVHLVVFATGFTVATAIIERSPWLWILTTLLVAAYLVAIRFVPRWRGGLQAVAQWSEVGAFLIALATFIWVVTHTTGTR